MPGSRSVRMELPLASERPRSVHTASTIDLRTIFFFFFLLLLIFFRFMQPCGVRCLPHDREPQVERRVVLEPSASGLGFAVILVSSAPVPSWDAHAQNEVWLQRGAMVPIDGSVPSLPGPLSSPIRTFVFDPAFVIPLAQARLLLRAT